VSRAISTAAPARIYLRPLGLLRSDVASLALANGFALPLGGRGGAFTAAEVWLRSDDRIERCTLSATEIHGWARRRGEEFEAALSRRLAAVTEPSAWPPGLPDRRPLIMGVVNVTPDSFSDGGRFLDPAAAIAHGRSLHAEGADIVDVGGESSRPGAAPVTADEEARRVLPVIEALAASRISVSIDTRKASVMRAAIAAGATMINDVSALGHDPESLAVAGASGCPVVLMHSQGEPATMQRQPTYACAPLDVFDHLERRIEAFVAAGFERRRLLIDPGIGFGKTVEQNLMLISRFDRFKQLGFPTLCGPSRKSFIGYTLDLPPEERVEGTAAAVAIAIARGADIIRVHDVKPMARVARMCDAILRR
jgi:dihydropteroate synthase